MKKISHWLVEFSTQKPLWVYALLLLIAVGAGSQIPRIQIDTDPENMLSEEHPSRVFHNQTKRDFAMHDAIVVGVVNDGQNGVYTQAALSDIHALTDDILAIEGVIDAGVMSVSTVDNISPQSLFPM